MKKRIKKQPRIIDVEPVEVSEVRAPAVPRPVRQAVPRDVPGGIPGKSRIPGKSGFPRNVEQPAASLDVAAYRFASDFALPWLEWRVGLPGLAEALGPLAEYWIAENVPKPPKPRRRLR